MGELSVGHSTTSAFDHEVDWLVAGAGAAGMTGAVVAHQLGGSALVVEKESLYGGTTAKSGGVAWIPGNHRQPEAGVEDSPEEGYTYLKGLIGDTVADARVRAYAERSSEMLRFMMTHSHVEYTALPEYMDYYDDVPGYKRGGRSMDPGTISLRRLGDAAKTLSVGHYDDLLLPFNLTVQDGRKLAELNLRSYLTGLSLVLRYLLDIPARLRGDRDNRLTLGTALVAKLRLSMLDRDIPLWLESPMKALITGEGRVIGAVVERNGHNARIRVRRGVLLATGGFSRNDALRRAHQQGPVRSEWSAAAPGATGDGILIGERAGAALDFMGSAWWSPTYTLPDGRVMALIAGKSNPGSIMVTQQGRRFTNEAQPYEDLVKAQYASHSRGEPSIPCYLIFDGVFRRRYAIGHIKPGRLADDSKIPAEYFETGLLTAAPTLGDLARKLGMDAATLEGTVNSFNEHARRGQDPEFGRGASEHDRYYADRRVTPNPSLAPLETAPYYALRCHPGDLDTKGGLVCDEFARVLDATGEVIPGLYAAGNTSAAVMGDTYPGAGATIGSAMTFAYIAAQHAFGDYNESDGKNAGSKP